MYCEKNRHKVVEVGWVGSGYGARYRTLIHSRRTELVY